jgi:glycosyltransferase involved in cell wall biosynthesis
MKAPGIETRYADHIAGLESDDLHIVFFTWPRALLGRSNIFHLHWPEQFVSNRGYVLSLASRVRSWMLLTRLRLSQTPVVRTLHSLTPHDDSTAASHRYQPIAKAFDRLTATDIHLVSEPELDRPQPRVSIPHGHYRRPLGIHGKADDLPGRLLYFGLIKKYKGVEMLLEVFSSVDDSDTVRALQAEAGSEWIFTFRAPLTAERLVEVMREADERRTLKPPALPERDWDVVRPPHRALYGRSASLAVVGEDV